MGGKAGLLQGERSNMQSDMLSLKQPPSLPPYPSQTNYPQASSKL